MDGVKYRFYTPFLPNSNSILKLAKIVGYILFFIEEKWIDVNRVNFFCTFLCQKVLFETQKIIFAFGKVLNADFSKKLHFEMWRPCVFWHGSFELQLQNAQTRFLKTKILCVLARFFLLLYVVVLRHPIFYKDHKKIVSSPSSIQ